MSSSPEPLTLPQNVYHVEGLGDLDDYGTYLDKWWSHKFIYFIRDLTAAQIEYYADTNPTLCRPLRCSYW